MCTLAAGLVFGDDSEIIKQERLASVQTISGTGALAIGARFLRNFFRVGEGIHPAICIPDPTWENHVQVFENALLQVTKYRYLINGCQHDIDGMIADIRKLPEGSIVLLHAWYAYYGCHDNSAHNPTGVDPTPSSWNIIRDVMIEKRHLAFFDCAYQGFASGDLEK